jgi:hypothetical protein
VGDTVESVGLLLAGGALVTQESFGGAATLWRASDRGSCLPRPLLFARAVLNIAVAAEAPCTVLFLNVRRI